MIWRQTDTMMVSKCIEYIEKEINEDRLKASDFVPVHGLKEAQAFMLYKAWRVHLVDRMLKEYDRNHLEDGASKPTSELEDDVRYYKKVQEKERATRIDYDDY
jgi:hypothetical protein